MSGADPRVRAVLKLAPVIPVFTPENVEDAVEVARALFNGGLPVIEVTLRTPMAMEAIQAMVEAVPDAVVGAGTVLTAAQMEQVKQVGGRFAVSPGATPRLYAAARDTDLPFLPGVATS
jgi:2-dehydro-3-deoxyphosphogluconate aldolase/(4S)-4-hydroxy-2-oxoglutarate aldolase